jgi:hypothetical protein
VVIWYIYNVTTPSARQGNFVKIGQKTKKIFDPLKIAKNGLPALGGMIPCLKKRIDSRGLLNRILTVFRAIFSKFCPFPGWSKISILRNS